MPGGAVTLSATTDIERVEAPVTLKAYFMCAFASFGGIFFGYDSGYINGVLGMDYYIHVSAISRLFVQRYTQDRAGGGGTVEQTSFSGSMIAQSLSQCFRDTLVMLSQGLCALGSVCHNHFGFGGPFPKGGTPRTGRINTGATLEQHLLTCNDCSCKLANPTARSSARMARLPIPGLCRPRTSP